MSPSLVVETYTLDLTGAGSTPSGYGPPGYAAVGGVEVANLARTYEYLKAGLGGPRFETYGGAACPALYRLAGPYASPALDPAPWYDAAQPASSEFLGVWLNDITPHPVAARAATDRQTRDGGALLGPRRATGRQIDYAGQLVAASDAGMRYGYRWLCNVLAGQVPGECDPIDAVVWLSCPPDDGSRDTQDYWVAYDVGVADGPTPLLLSQGCGVFDVAWTLVASRPHLYTVPSVCAPGVTPTPKTGHTGFGPWILGAPTLLASCGVQPPVAGGIVPEITITAPSGIETLTLGAFESCPPNLSTDSPTHHLTIELVPPGVLRVDATSQRVTYDDGTGPVDGRMYVRGDPIRAMRWLAVDAGDPETCFAVYVTYGTGSGDDMTVQIDTRGRSL